MDKETQATDTDTCTDTMPCHDHDHDQQLQQQEQRPPWIASMVSTAASLFALSAGAIIVINTIGTTSGSSKNQPPTEFVRKGRTLSDIPYHVEHGQLEPEVGDESSSKMTNWLQEFKIATMPTPSFVDDDGENNGGGDEFFGDEGEGEGGVRSTILPTVVVVTDPVEEFTDTTTSSSSSSSSTTTTSSTTTSTTTSSAEEDLSTTTTTATATSEDAPYYWIPIQPTIKGMLPYCSYTDIYPDAYAHASMKHITLFESETECCTTYGHPDGLCAQSSTTLGDEEGTDAGLEDEAGATEYWYPTQANGAPSCVHNAAYPDDFTHEEFTASFLFNSQVECCEAWPAACYHFFWYPIEVVTTEEGMNIRECVYGEDYPSVEYDSIFLSQDDCCERWECGVEVSTESDAAGSGPTTTVATNSASTETTESASTLSTIKASSITTETPVESTTTASELPSSTTVDATSTESTSTTTTSTTPEPTTTTSTTTTYTTTTTTTTTTSTQEVNEPCSSHTCTWHESTAAHATCTNSNEYPSAWDDIPESQHHYFFFESAEECCSMRYPDECTVVDVGGDVESTGSDMEGGRTEATAPSGSEFITVTSYTKDDFESSQLTIPFDLSNQNWEITSTKSHSGVQSITNTHNATSGKAADTAELVLKINLPAPTSISCMALIDTSMPFDYFTLIINGQQRNTYHQHHEEWMHVLTGLGSGENTIVFRVENGGEGVDFLDRDYDHFGSGSVYLDDCEIGATF